MLTLAQALAELPDTADGIAAKLAAEGHRGNRRGALFCPLASWLRSRGIDTPGVSVDEICALRGDRRGVVPPPAVAEFIRRFDAGEWPALDRTQTAGATA